MHGYVVFCLLSLVFVGAFTDFSFPDVECKLIGGSVFFYEAHRQSRRTYSHINTGGINLTCSHGDVYHSQTPVTKLRLILFVSKSPSD